LLDSKEKPETFSAESCDEGGGSSDDARVVQALTSLNSELANAQRELARKNAELNGAIREKNQLLGMAAHDLRNPLGIIVGIIDLLGEELAASLSAENRELFSRVATSAAYMVELIDDMLDYSKIDAGRLELELHPVDIADLIRQNLAFNSILASKKEIKLRFESAAQQPPGLNLDSRRIQQVLNNLISNALKFAHSGSAITVTLLGGAGEVTIAIADQGQGIAADELGELFTPFSSTSTRSTANEKSTGLGLAIVRRIVEAHSGHIRVESELGRGSTFYVSLPITPKL
jgi:two-component system, OmpR family, sensor kinase